LTAAFVLAAVAATCADDAPAPVPANGNQAAIRCPHCGNAIPLNQPLGSSFGGMTFPALPGSEFGPFYDHASTWQQGILDGWASAVRAYGLADYNHSLAACNWQAAEEAAIRNYVTGINAFKEVKAERKAELAARCRAAGSRLAAKRQIATKHPPAFTDEQLAPGGRILWPKLLADTTFATLRQTIDRSLAQWYAQGQRLTRQQRGELKQAVRTMERELARRCKTTNADEYLAARQLLGQIVAVACSDRTAQAHSPDKLVSQS
jgi:hypothetical protein